MTPDDSDLAIITQLNRKIEQIQGYNFDVEKLRRDGSNLRRWKQRTERSIFYMTYIQRFWDTPPINPDTASPIECVIDRCAFRVVEVTVDDHIRDWLSEADYAHQALDIITRVFKLGGRTMQFASWNTLWERHYDTNLDSFLTFAIEVKRDMEKLEGQGFEWTRDGIEGMILQQGARSSSGFDLNEDVNQSLGAKNDFVSNTFTSEEVRKTIMALLQGHTSHHRREQRVILSEIASLGLK